ncbi:hypothetical protein FACS189461_3340 [Spirochaetia bacterium]|nr:hypothetical protein FACS189461_3340 [Spirochaetia bacterium]
MEKERNGIDSGSGGSIKIRRFLPGKLEGHFQNHAGDFEDVRSPGEYEEKARQFFDKMPTADMLWFEDVDGFFYRYNKRKNEFGVCSPEGFIITFFKPTKGIDYWYEQEKENGI